MFFKIQYSHFNGVNQKTNVIDNVPKKYRHNVTVNCKTLDGYLTCGHFYKWLREQKIAYVSQNNVWEHKQFWFKNTKDAMLFKLRWGG